MKKLLLLSTLLVAVSAPVYAAQLTPEQAVARLGLGNGRASVPEMKLVYTASEGHDNQFYIFNVGSNDGFSVVSADDCISPLIGYADSGSFDPENIPDNMRAWLGSYKRQIEAIINGASPATSRVAMSSIAPLVKTQWNQSSPYNNDCPMDGDSRAVTGCVATAMAQVMKYHNWPPKGTGSNSYTWTNSKDEKITLSKDFSAITFDWANMTDTYSSQSSVAQNQAVATLMAACGYSVNMMYSNISSGAYSPMIPYALGTYFNYDPDVRYVVRDYYGLEEWENMIYTELAAGRPVIYDGVTSDRAGHEFVCDGYENGYFHINWGWGGMSDGFFKLTLLSPDNQGIGGSNSGYNYSQGAVIGIQKNVSGGKYVGTPLMLAESFTVVDSSYGDMLQSLGTATIAKSDVVYFGSMFWNSSVTPVSLDLGVKLVNKINNETKYYKWAIDGGSEALEYGQGYRAIPFYATTLPAMGEYIVTPAYCDFTTGEWHDVLVPVSNPTITMKCTSKSLVFTKSSAVKLKATDLKLETKLYAQSPYKISANLTVEGGEYYGTVLARLYARGSSRLVATDTLDIVDFLPGETFNYESIGNFKTLSTGGTYDLALADNAGNVISDKITVTVLPPVGKTVYGITDITPVGKLVNGYTQMPMDQIRVEATVKCSSGYLAKPVAMYLFPYANGSFGSGVAAFMSEQLFLEAGQSAEITVSGAYSYPGIYAVAFFDGSEQLTNPVLMELTDPMSGVEDVMTEEIIITPNPATDYVTVKSPTVIRQIEIYSISGMKMSSVSPSDNMAEISVSEFPSGYYVVTIATENGVVTKRLIKR